MMTDGSTIGLVATSSVLAAALTQMMVSAREWWTRGRSSDFSALSFRVAIENENAKVAATFEFGEDDDGAFEVREAAATLGLRAITLAGDLRRRHGIDPLALDPQWNVEAHLSEKRDAYVVMRQARDEANRRMWIEMEDRQEPPAGDQPNTPEA